jgi:hypothetical protein
VGFVVEKVAVGRVFLRILRFSHVTIVPSMPSYSNNKIPTIDAHITFAVKNVVEYNTSSPSL